MLTAQELLDIHKYFLKKINFEKLTEWEQQFVKSTSAQFKMTGKLSDKQAVRLLIIFDRTTGPIEDGLLEQEKNNIIL